MLAVEQWIKIAPGLVYLNGESLFFNTKLEDDTITLIYRQCINNYPKFFKMDGLSRLGFIATELLLQNVDKSHFADNNCAILLFNIGGSVNTDYYFQRTITDANNFFPSPSIFVYTLPNIVTGEIAIRHHFYGETASYVLGKWNPETIIQIVESTFDSDGSIEKCICGWVEYINEQVFEADLFLVSRTSNCEHTLLTEKTITTIKKFNMEQTIFKLKEEIIEVLNLEDMQPNDIDNDMPLFGDGLGLDSVDGLELIVLLEKNYGIKLDSPALYKEIFRSINVLADFIIKNRTK